MRFYGGGFSNTVRPKPQLFLTGLDGLEGCARRGLYAIALQMLQGCKPTHIKLPGSMRKRYYHEAGLQSETSSWKLFASICRVNNLFSSIWLICIICSCLTWGLSQWHDPNDPLPKDWHPTMLRKALRLDQRLGTSCQCPFPWRSYLMYSLVTCVMNLACRTTNGFSCRSCSSSTSVAVVAEGNILLGRRIRS